MNPPGFSSPGRASRYDQFSKAEYLRLTRKPNRKMPSQLDLLGGRERTHLCGDLRPSHAGQDVFLAGWVDRRRDLGNLVFLDLRDHRGVTQVVCNKETSPGSHLKAERVRPEYVVAVRGKVVLRSNDTVNKQLATGEVEVHSEELLVLNEAKTPPFPVSEETRTAEETRLRYRFLDLRRGRMQRNLRLRHEAAQTVREVMTRKGFVEIETPFLTRSTPEGARDFLVPSRTAPGNFYALPQSPQIFKQLLMISGFDRYFQIVRCFRDEDLRADRQPEFTQIDVEMAFPQRDLLFSMMEDLMEALFGLIGEKIARPFPRLTHAEAMEKYGSDKPHLGYPLEWRTVSLPDAEQDKIRLQPPLKALRMPGGARVSRSQLDRWQDLARANSISWFSYLKANEGGTDSPLKKALGESICREMRVAAGAEPGDLVLLLGRSADAASVPSQSQLDIASGELRNEVINKLELKKSRKWNFAWVTDFPMFEYNEQDRRFTAVHHPFTSPREEDLEQLESHPAAVKAQAYDLVLNGSEIGGGSIRIHRRDIQIRVFQMLGFTDEQARERFGFFLEALEYGTPPHGGIALGFDRIVTLMAGESSIRDLIAFPKTASGMDLMCRAPAEVDASQLDELGLSVRKK